MKEDTGKPIVSSSRSALARVTYSDTYGAALTFTEARDGARIARQRRAVHAAMADGRWHTLAGLAEHLDYPEASISARIRDLRKARYGGHTVERKYGGSGLWFYRVVLRSE